MKLLVFGKPALRSEKPVFDHLLDRGRQAGWHIEQRSTIERDDVAAMELYDVVQTPAFLIVHSDGAVAQVWQHALPTYDDLAAHFL